MFLEGTMDFVIIIIITCHLHAFLFLAEQDSYFLGTHMR